MQYSLDLSEVRKTLRMTDIQCVSNNYINTKKSSRVLKSSALLLINKEFNLSFDQCHLHDQISKHIMRETNTNIPIRLIQFTFI